MKYTEDFLAFWGVHSYGSKQRAFDQFRKMNGELPDDALETIKGQLEYSAGSTNEDFRAKLPHLERWFRDRRWEEGRQEATTKKRSKEGQAHLDKLRKGFSL